MLRTRRSFGRTIGFGLASLTGLRAQSQIQTSQTQTLPRKRPTPREEKRPPANLRVDTNLVLVPVTGGDNSSRYTESEVRNMVRENDVLLYAIGVYEGGGGRMRTPEEAAGPGLLTELCEQTGGRHLPADASELPDIAAKIGVELRNRYVLGFVPQNKVRDGRYHVLQVKMVPPKGLPPLKPYFR